MITLPGQCNDYIQLFIQAVFTKLLCVPQATPEKTINDCQCRLFCMLDTFFDAQ